MFNIIYGTIIQEWIHRSDLDSQEQKLISPIPTFIALVRWEARDFHNIPRDLANVNKLKIMFDPYIKRKIYFCHFSNSLLFIWCENQMPFSKFNNHFVIFVLSLLLCCIIRSDIDSSRSHPNYDWHRTKWVRASNDLVLLVFERPPVTGGQCTWSSRSRPSLT